LTVLRRTESNSQGTRWICVCECGTEMVATGCRLKSVHTASCGCLRADQMAAVATVHGQSMTKLHRVLRSMRGRCLNPSDPAYKHYGGRGISICEKWKTDAAAFMEWAHANGYREGLTIDRIDNDGDYTPENCRWVDRFVQRNNCRNNRRHDYRGKSYTLAQLARIADLAPGTIANRIDAQGMTVEQAVETPPLRASRPRKRESYVST
jgi:hypothetical protein